MWKSDLIVSFLLKIPLLLFCFSYLTKITHFSHEITKLIMIKLTHAFSFRVLFKKKRGKKKQKNYF